MRGTVTSGLAIAAAMVFSGCFGALDAATNPRPSFPPVPAGGSDAVEGSDSVTCLVTDEANLPLAGATCTVVYPNGTTQGLTNISGRATLAVEPGVSAVLTASADGRVVKTAPVVTNYPTAVRFVLETSEDEGTRATGGGVAAWHAWGSPTMVSPIGRWEPMVRVGDEGTVWVSPTYDLYRSTDGGLTFDDVTPREPATVRTMQLGTDTAVSVAPDGSIWWLKNLSQGGVSPIVACMSEDEGETWTCHNAAVPGVVDRMAVAAISKDEAYIATLQGWAVTQWYHTNSGPLGLAPHAAGDGFMYGNMHWDADNQIVWHVSGTQLLMVNRLDEFGHPERVPLPFSQGHGHASVTSVNGTVWVRGEEHTEDRRVFVAGRTSDQGKSWDTFPVSVEPASVALTSIAAGPDGRVVAMYFGTDRPEDPETSLANWYAYGTQSIDAGSPYPTWVEQRITFAHTGGYCHTVACAEQGPDPEARQAGEFTGAWVDSTGNGYLVFNLDNQDAEDWPVHLLRTWSVEAGAPP